MNRHLTILVLAVVSLAPGFAQAPPPPRRTISPVTVEALKKIEAVKDLAEAQVIFNSVKDHNELATAVGFRGRDLFDAGDFAGCQYLQQVQLADALAVGDNGRAGHALMNLALSSLRLGRHRDAIRYSESGFHHSIAVNDKINLGNLYLIAGNGHRILGEADQALAAYIASRDLCREIDNTNCELSAINNIGLLQVDQGEYSAAAATFHAGLPRAINDNNEATFLGNLAMCYGEQGDPETASVYFERSLQASRRVGDKERATVALMNLAETYEVRKMYKEGFAAAEEAIRASADLRRPRIAGLALVSRGNLNRSVGNSKEALADWQRAVEVLQSDSQTRQAAKVLAQIAKLQASLHQDAAALETATKAQAAATTVNNNEALRSALDTFGLVYLRSGRVAEAKSAFEREISLIESARTKITGGEIAALFLAEKLNPYYGLMQIAISEHQEEAALRSIEHSKARHLLDVLAGGHAALTRNMTSEERAQERKLIEDVENKTIAAMRSTASAEVRTQLDVAQRELTAFHSILFAAHPELKFRREESAPFAIADAEALLPRTGPQTALIEYALFDDRLFIFLLSRSRPQGPVTLRVTSTAWTAADAARETEAYRAALAGQRLSYRTGAQALYQRLIAPIAADLKGKSAIGIVPDGVLWNVPFQTLIQPTGKHLLEDYAVFYAPSLTVLRETAKSAPTGNGKTLLALGAPSLGRFEGAFEPDPESGREVREIGALYPSAKVLSGDVAVKKAWLADASNSDFLHLATHGVLNTNNPLYSYLVMADGVLEAREILDVNLRSKVVVLSACETGRGSVSPGEGLIGMSWAFLVAGSRSTVVSQWKVDSSSTRELMLRFHRALRQTSTTPVYALQRAALETMRTPGQRHPFFWAGFVMVGATP